MSGGTKLGMVAVFGAVTFFLGAAYGGWTWLYAAPGIPFALILFGMLMFWWGKVDD